jgi:hypothetical protein
LFAASGELETALMHRDLSALPDQLEAFDTAFEQMLGTARACSAKASQVGTGERST